MPKKKKQTKSDKVVKEIHHLKEIHNTELPGITYEHSVTSSLTEGEFTHISVRDKTSNAALETFDKIKKRERDEQKRKDVEKKGNHKDNAYPGIR